MGSWFSTDSRSDTYVEKYTKYECTNGDSIWIGTNCMKSDPCVHKIWIKYYYVPFPISLTMDCKSIELFFTSRSTFVPEHISCY
jgi:hypothetical protein